MSDRIPCNFCLLDRIRKGNKDKKVRVIPNSISKLGGYDVYVCPKDLSLGRMLEKKSSYWIAWFVDISDKCYC